MNRLVIYGVHTVDAVLRKHPERLVQIWCDSKRRDEQLSALRIRAEQQGVTVGRSEPGQLDSMTGGELHQGVVAEIHPLAVQDEQSLIPFVGQLQEPPFLLLLDGVQDPHNLGACLRSADAAGVHALIIPKDRACPVTATVYKVASGAAGLTPIFRVTNLARAMQHLQAQGVWLVGAEEQASQPLYRARLDGPLGIVLGGEGRGLRRLTREKCDLLVRIPLCGFVSSLNVSVAAGVCLYEARRQRNDSD